MRKRSVLGKPAEMDKPRVIIQVFLRNNGQVGVSSTSANHITNLGLIGVAQAIFQKQVTPEDPSRILKPELNLGMDV